jgi:hypothetical protein
VLKQQAEAGDITVLGTSKNAEMGVISSGE